MRCHLVCVRSNTRRARVFAFDPPAVRGEVGGKGGAGHGNRRISPISVRNATSKRGVDARQRAAQWATGNTFVKMVNDPKIVLQSEINVKCIHALALVHTVCARMMASG